MEESGAEHFERMLIIPPLSKILQPPGALFGRVFVAMDMGWKTEGFGDVRTPKLFRARLSRLEIPRLEHQRSRLVRQQEPNMSESSLLKVV
jgi:hypothetical protein